MRSPGGGAPPCPPRRGMEARWAGYGQARWAGYGQALYLQIAKDAGLH
jgi:hypothetical protein